MKLISSIKLMSITIDRNGYFSVKTDRGIFRGGKARVVKDGKQKEKIEKQTRMAKQKSKSRAQAARKKKKEILLADLLKRRLERWVNNHPDVWQENEFGVPHFWWVQNAIGDLVGWQGGWAIFTSNLMKKHSIKRKGRNV